MEWESEIQMTKEERNKDISNTMQIWDDLPIDVFTIDLRDAYDLLGEIIGETYKDDLLDELFSKFCLGK